MSRKKRGREGGRIEEGGKGGKREARGGGGERDKGAYREMLGLSLILWWGRTFGYSLEQMTFMEATLLRALR